MCLYLALPCGPCHPPPSVVPPSSSLCGPRRPPPHLGPPLLWPTELSPAPTVPSSRPPADPPGVPSSELPQGASTPIGPQGSTNAGDVPLQDGFPPGIPVWLGSRAPEGPRPPCSHRSSSSNTRCAVAGGRHARASPQTWVAAPGPSRLTS